MGRRRFSREFKEEAVRLASVGDRSLSQVARELGIQPSVLSRWRKRLEREAAEPAGESAESELKRLRRELERVRQQRDILKKATAYFANQRD